MKRVLLIIFLIVFCFSLNVEASLKFGDWDKWDEELPPWNNIGWKEKENWSIFASYPLLPGSIVRFYVDGDWVMLKLDDKLNESQLYNVFFLLTRLSFTDKKNKVSIVLLSSLPIEKINSPLKFLCTEEALRVAELALVVFPPQKGEVLVLAYKKNKEFSSLVFLEKWVALFKDNTILLPENNDGFRQQYQSWIEKQKVAETYQLLPRLVITNEKKKEFLVGIGLQILENSKIKTTIVF
ncbi:MAG: hypothetical protein PHH35_01295 [Candidatus Pacebacteria bacterium]|nr:hypothetical protein [Candidatus Paceibacterota bacterium]